MRNWFDLAKAESEKSDFPRIHIGAVVIYKGRPLAYGHNSLKTHPQQKIWNRYRGPVFTGKDIPVPTIHAEMQCLVRIRKLGIPTTHVQLYIYRQKANGQLGMCRPCAGCMAAIREAGIRDIYYTTDYGYAHEVIVESSVSQKGGCYGSYEL